MSDAADTGWLAVLSVGKNKAHFIDTRDLTDAVAGLRPVESRFTGLHGPDGSGAADPR
uniref:Uncharacterized protein n=1 Tax=Streptomyces sp. NBC_00093 TaxID=2975649 RepID=A0AAU2A159_9ACTN